MDRIDKFLDDLEETFAHIREREGNDSVCGLCEYDGAYIGESGDWYNECPGFNKDDCFKLSAEIRRKWKAQLSQEGTTKDATPSTASSTAPSTADTISRQAAIDALDCISGVEEVLRSLPSVQPEERTDKRTETHACEEKPFKLPKIYVAEGFDSIEDEDGNIGFGVYVPAENKIYVAGDVDDEIRAKALLHEVCHWVQDICGRPFDEDEANEFSDIVYNALPSAQPEQKTGYWIPVTNGRGGHECSRCHDYAPSYQNGEEYLANYCPNCGADMRGE